MNQRIKELFDIAQGSIDPMDEQANVFEKFAELIVRECVEQVEVFNVRMDARPRHIIEAIKEHFGIKE